MKVTACLRCGQQPNEKDNYCINCGSPLSNRCLHDGGPFGDPCNQVNSPEAAYCAKCGGQTMFNRAGLVRPAYQYSNRPDVNEDLDSFTHFDHKFFE